MKKRIIVALVLLVYSVMLIKVMVFKQVPPVHSGAVTLDFGGTVSDHPANFIPFMTILPYLLGEKGMMIAVINLVGNIVLLIPLGFLVSVLYRKTTWKKISFLGFGTGIFIECLQVLLNVGIFDIDDVLLNAVGFIIGYFALLFSIRYLREKRYKTLLGAAVLTGCAAIATLYAINPWNQTIVNPQVGINVGGLRGGNREKDPSKQIDLCGGTGGTGEIIHMTEHSFTIISKKGREQTITVTSETNIKNSSGSATMADLHVGDHVTVVIDETETASAIFLCSAL